VGFKGASDATLEVLAGRVHYSLVGLASALPFIKDGRLLALAVASPRPSPLLPDVPLLSEVLPGYERDGSHSLFAPAGTPKPILRKISKDVARVFELPEVKERLQNFDFMPAPTTPEEHERIVRADIDTFAKVIRLAGLR
jgi:tripartite-type tricarboxylate transporter receptor subunit TctC